MDNVPHTGWKDQSGGGFSPPTPGSLGGLATRVVSSKSATEVLWLNSPRGAFRLCSSFFQYRCRSCLLSFKARWSSSDNGFLTSAAACCRTASSATCGRDGSDAMICWGSGVPETELSEGIDARVSRFFALWWVEGAVEGLVTRDWLPKERVPWPFEAAVRRRGGILSISGGARQPDSCRADSQNQ